MNTTEPSRRRPASVSERYRGALVGCVVGDALGAPFEGHPGSVPYELLSQFLVQRSTLRYTDDSAMAFALAESLLSCGRLDLDHLAATFAATYDRDPHRGYGGAAARLLTRVAAGESWRHAAASQFGGEGSFGNGAAMRVAPIALHASGAVVVAAGLGRESAIVTHTHPAGVDAAGVQAAAVALALSGDALDDRDAFVEAVRDTAETDPMRTALEQVASLPGGSTPADVAAVTGTGIAGTEAVPAAIAVATLHPDSFADAVPFAITLGGDTDTIAAMAGAITGAHVGEAAIPATWRTRAEGVATAQELADRFVARRGSRADPGR